MGAENGSLSDGPSDTERKDMSQIQGKQDPAILSRDNSRIMTFPGATLQVADDGLVRGRVR